MRSLLLLVLVWLGTLVYANPSNDNFANAIDVTALIGSCSSDAQYTNIGATADLNEASCWNTDGAEPDYNVWFKFTVPASGNIKVTVDRGGTKGTIKRINLAIWQSDGTTEVACDRYIGNNDDVDVSAVGLTVGATYYISVDSRGSSRRGTFTLCLSDNPGYDMYEGALDVTSLINSCSADSLYSNYGADTDRNEASCWNTAGSNPDFNVWFKFTAPASGFITCTVDRGAEKGTIRRVNLALWQNDGLTEIACNRYTGDDDDVKVASTGLTPGAVYYISVDSKGSNYTGNFTLCLSDDVNNDFYERATDITSLFGSCSGDAAYSNVGYTSDKNEASCWDTDGSDPDRNAWFKFTAPGSGSVKLTIDRGGSKGTIKHAQAAIWEADGVTQVACNKYISQDDDVSVATVGLTPGAMYYVSIDNKNKASEGTFSLCLEDNPGYDFYEGAVDVTSIIGGCSSDSIYSTRGATSDRNEASCWNTAGSNPDYNVWFKFTAPVSGQIRVRVDRGAEKGTIRKVNLALWENDGITQVACNRYYDADADVELSALNITPGNTYYISVDNKDGGSRGNFTLCLYETLTYDSYEAATDITSLFGTCSSDSIYSNLGATSDKNEATCWNTAGSNPDYNVWFKFTAPASGISVITIDRGGEKGDITNVNAAIWESDGTTQVVCNRYANADDDVVVAAKSLTPGGTYYLSVDSKGGASRGSFTLCLSENLSYDFYEAAVDVTSLIGSCSSDAQYSTAGATPDGVKASCWNTAGTDPDYNVWFKFTAPVSGEFRMVINTGGVKGTLKDANVAIWESDGSTEVACARYLSSTDDIDLATDNLTSGATYYISVDNRNIGSRGSFTMCLYDGLNNDFFQAATDVTSMLNSCSFDGQFSNAYASSDKTEPACWNTSGSDPDRNVWFKFTAPATGNVQATVDIGDSKGSATRINAALWENDGTTLVDCKRYSSGSDDVSVGSVDLTPGNVYYLSVDNNSFNRRGTFSLCFDKIDTTYYSLSDGDWNNPNTWSLSGHGGSPSLAVPSEGDFVYISGSDITANSPVGADSIVLNVSSDNTSLTLDNTTLTVANSVNLTNTGSNFDGNISLTNGASISSGGDLRLNRQGGINAFGVTMSSSCSLVVNNLKMVSTGGSSNENVISLTDGYLEVQGSLELESTAGVKNFISLNNASELTVGSNVVFTNSASSLGEIELNGSSKLSLAGNFTRTSSYGDLDMNGTSTLEFNGSAQQTIPKSLGAGGDEFSYQNVELNNSFAIEPQFILDGPLFVNGNLVLTDGVLESTNVNRLFVMNGGGASGGSANSYVTGPVSKLGVDAFTFPLGLNGSYAPIGMSAPSVVTDNFTAQYYQDNPGSTYDGSSKDANIESMSTGEYWTLDRIGSSAVDVVLSWDSTRSETLGELNELIVCRWDGSQWQDHGNGGFTGNDSIGTLTSGEAIVNFSPFVLGKAVNPGAVLPIELLSFEAEVENGSVMLDWVTSSEISNDFFTVEKSVNLNDWTLVANVDGAGNSTQSLSYEITDQDPFLGKSYYRLKQTDFDGSYAYFTPRSVDVVAEYHVYPNPFNYTIFIEGEELNEVNVTNIIGQDVTHLVEIHFLSDKQIIIDAAALPKGVFLINVNGVSQRLTKQ